METLQLKINNMICNRTKFRQDKLKANLWKQEAYYQGKMERDIAKRTKQLEIKDKLKSWKKITKKDKVSIEWKLKRSWMELTDSIAQRYAKAKDCDNQWYWTCCTCWKRLYWTEWQGWHWIGRANLWIRWNVKNIHLQCASCNCWGGGRTDEYKLYVNSRYGKDTREILHNIQTNWIEDRKKWYIIDLAILCGGYIDNLNKLNKAKRIFGLQERINILDKKFNNLKKRSREYLETPIED